MTSNTLQLSLLMAIESSNLGDFLKALADGAAPNGAAGDQSGSTWKLPLTEAAERWDTTFVLKLLAAGADPLLADGMGITPLMNAVIYSNGPVVELLAPLSDMGALANDGRSALMIAIKERSFPSWLQDSPLLSSESCCCGPLGSPAHFAAQLPMCVDLELFNRIAALCDPWARDGEGRTALQVLCKSQYTGQELKASILLSAMEASAPAAQYLRELTFCCGLLSGTSYSEMIALLAPTEAVLWDRLAIEAQAGPGSHSAKKPRI